MQRRGLLVLASVCCALGVDLAFADRLPVTLEGPLERGGHAKVEISKDRVQGTRMERYRWEFRRISVRCEGERRIVKGALTGGFAINAAYGGPGDWGIQGTTAGKPGDPVHATKVRGRLVSWSKARGWIRLWGSEIRLRGGGRAECDSGRLHWIARG